MLGSQSITCSSRAGLLLVVSLTIGLGAVMARAETVPPDAILMPDALFENVEAARLGHHLYLSPKNLEAAGSSNGQVKMPRLASSLTSLHWLGQAADKSLSLKVEQDYWIVAWTQRPADSQVIVLSFDAPPKLLSELQPITPAGDGSVFLEASQASTHGEKIRYEPQTFKNTVGYWVGKQDFAQWKFETVQPATYNVAILQGCGEGQGGSRALLSVYSAQPEATPEGAAQAELEFEVLETGHFQNFHWRHLGQISLTTVGLQTLKLAPIAVKKNALMDVRAIHLIPVPR